LMRQVVNLRISIVVIAILALTGCVPLAPPTPTLTPQLSSLLFSSDRSGDGEIYLLAPDGSLTNLTANPSSDWDGCWSPDGKRIAFTSHRTGDSEIFIMDADGGNPVNFTQNPAWDYSPAWSPTGEQIAFISERDGRPRLHVQPVNGGAARRLTNDNEQDRLPAWSPDSRHIAFSAIRGGVEEIHIVSADGGEERIVTAPPLKGTAPAWSPDGKMIAFVGWGEDYNPGIYILHTNDGSITQVYQGKNAWIGSLDWSQPPPENKESAQWLLYTSWETGHHEIYALQLPNGQPIQLTSDPAWNDFPKARPGVPLALPKPAASPPAFSKSQEAHKDFGYGVNMADLSTAYLVRDMGFTWAKGYVNWETVEPEKGNFRWIDPDNVVNAYEAYGLKILLRVHGTPAWARPPDTQLSYPANDPRDFADFITVLATRYRGRVAAYEIWNEENLNYEWGYRQPDPAEYTPLLRAAYQAIKAADPEAVVLSGGLATTGDGSPTATGDLKYLQGIYDNGGRGYFDALGSHPYAYGHPPDYEDPWGLSISRVVAQHYVMQQNGDKDKPVWITEVGWVLKASWDLGEHAKIAVTEEQQAEYLVRAYKKAHEEWPWVKAIFLFNLDFSIAPWYQASEPMRWYAILNPDRTPRPAYTRLRMMIMGK
jgi:Tol biopolymer transport system component